MSLHEYVCNELYDFAEGDHVRWNRGFSPRFFFCFVRPERNTNESERTDCDDDVNVKAVMGYLGWTGFDRK